MSAPWWRTSAFYQIYPRSFRDTSGDGVGDLEGIRRQLDHVAWLGVDAIWLSPFYRSPMADFGYDVADHCDVDPLLGSLEDFDRLLAEAHAHGLRVIIDWVPNHTSDQHRWFQASRSARDDPQRDWYVWRDSPEAAEGQPPNNWVRAFGEGPAWTWDERTAQWYLHLFLPQQPDLDWNNPQVQAAQHDVLRFWLDRGVDGFRADVVHLIGKDPALPDDPPELAGTSRVGFHDEPRTHGLLRDIRATLEGYDGERTMVGEVNLSDTEALVRYYGAGDELPLVFNFVPLHAPWTAEAWRAVIDEIERCYDRPARWPTWVLSNHDEPRHRTRYGGDERIARAAALLLLTLRGTPFLYAGEELGLEDAHVPPHAQVDPGGRDGCRAPIPWTGEPDHGWTSSEPWLPWPPEADHRNAAALRADPDSILHRYRALLAARRASPALREGELSWLHAPADTVAFRRSLGGDERLVAVSFVDEPREVAVPGDREIEVASDGVGDGEPFTGTLAPLQAVLLR